MSPFTPLASAALLLAALAPSHAQAPAKAAANSKAASKPAAKAAKSEAPCSLATPDQIKTLIGAPVQPGQPAAADCTWRDAKGDTRVYLSLRDSKDFHSFRSQMQTTGKMVPITGVGEDAFFVSSTGSSAALYALKKTHVLLLTVDGPGYSKAENEAAEQALANQILAKL